MGKTVAKSFNEKNLQQVTKLTKELCFYVFQKTLFIEGPEIDVRGEIVSYYTKKSHGLQTLYIYDDPGLFLTYFTASLTSCQNCLLCLYQAQNSRCQVSVYRTIGRLVLIQ